MNIPHDKFCVLPWVSLEASPIGTVRPCCLADDELVDDAGEKFSLLTADFADIQNSNSMKSLREQFLAGKKPQTCRKCWNEERAGRTSKRMHTLDRMKHMGISPEWTTDSKPLMFLDLKLGNICNLKCRICGSWSSSQFAAEELRFTRKEEDQKTTFHYQMLKAGAWPRENTQFWNEIDSVLTDIRYIEFTGGEPFMIKEHFQMLQGIVDKGIAHQVEIHYNTNGTQYPEEAVEIWKHFKTVEIAFSIDDLAARFEYQRSNAVWSEVEQNIGRFRALRAEHSNIQLQCCSTVNVFNVRYIDQLAHWIETQGFDFVYWNMMHDSWYFSIATLPDSAKQAITEHLNSADIPAKHKDEFERIVAFMNNGVSTDGDILRMRVRDLDFKRQQNLADVEPEFAALINYDFNS
jgi:sulfatase maturation enzyme AslB (radical SAM superfamily)